MLFYLWYYFNTFCILLQSVVNVCYFTAKQKPGTAFGASQGESDSILKNWLLVHLLFSRTIITKHMYITATPAPQVF